MSGLPEPQTGWNAPLGQADDRPGAQTQDDPGHAEEGAHMGNSHRIQSLGTCSTLGLSQDSVWGRVP